MSGIQITGIVICAAVGLVVVIGFVSILCVAAFEEEERWAQWTLSGLAAALLTAAALAAFGVFG